MGRVPAKNDIGVYLAYQEAADSKDSANLLRSSGHCYLPKRLARQESSTHTFLSHLDDFCYQAELMLQHVFSRLGLQMGN